MRQVRVTRQPGIVDQEFSAQNLALGLSIGTGIGLIAGLFIGNLALGLTLGAGLGLSVGMVIDSAKSHKE